MRSQYTLERRHASPQMTLNAGVSPTTLTTTWSGIMGDVIPEGPETLIREIGSNPSVYILGPNFQTSLTILSDE